MLNILKYFMYMYEYSTKFASGLGTLYLQKEELFISLRRMSQDFSVKSQLD